jgi:hypothetical protein
MLLVAMTCPVVAGILPSFHLDYNAWEATHIVVVEATAEDDTFEVIESWKGDLQPGRRIRVPAIRPGAGAAPLSMYPDEPEYLAPGDTSRSTQIPRLTPGDRLVLFLIKETQPEKSTDTRQDQGARWQPANSFHDMKTSAVWIDGAKLYGFSQLMNPGPSILNRLPWIERDESKARWKVRAMTAADLQARVHYVVRIEEELATVVQEKDPAARAENLRTYVRSDVQAAQSLAFAELARAGPSALPVLRAMLDDPDYAKFNEMVMHAYVQAGGNVISEELSARLRNELAFWKATGPSLAPNWWNDDATPGALLRQRYMATLEILRGLETSRALSALNTAIALRDFWRSLPQLNNSGGLYQLADECDKVIRQLQP